MNVTILGSTGSIGVNTLDVVRQHGERFTIHGLVAGHNIDVLCSQILEFRPAIAIAADAQALDRLCERLIEAGLPRKQWPELGAGPRARVQAATADKVDFVMSAIVGVAGLEATYEAIKCKKRIGLANIPVASVGAAARIPALCSDCPPTGIRQGAVAAMPASD